MARVFSPRAVPVAPYFVSRWAYLTDIQTAEDGTEQRIALRTIPTETWAFTVRALALFGQGWRKTLLQGALYGDVATAWAIPQWPDGQHVTAAVTPGSSRTVTVESSTTGRGYVAGGLAILWTDERTAEVCTIASVGASSVVLATVAGAYAAGAYLFPARLGRLTGAQEIGRRGARNTEVRVEFALELGTAPSVTRPTQAEVFDVVPVNRETPTDLIDRRVRRLDNNTYTFAEYAHRAYGIGAMRDLPLWLVTRANQTALLTWFHELRGRWTTFYLPTYTEDLDVLAGLGTGTLTIRACAYTARLFPDIARRTLACIQPNGTVTKVFVRTAEDNGNGTETLTLDLIAPGGTRLVSWCLYGRLAEDALELRWLNNTVAEASIGFQETPAELAPVVFVDPGGGENQEPEPPSPPNPAAGPAVAATSTAVVPGGREDVATLFAVTLRDANGLVAASGNLTVAAAVTGTNTATPSITRLSQSRYQGRYVPADDGTDTVAITYGGAPIHGSPFTSVVAPTPVTLPGAIRYGLWANPSARYSLAPDTANGVTRTPNDILAWLATLAAAGMTGCFVFPRATIKDGTGKASLSRFQAMVDLLMAVPGITDYFPGSGVVGKAGTLTDHQVIDEPFAMHYGGQDVPGATLAAMCAYSKANLTTVRTNIRAEPARIPSGAFVGGHLDLAWAQYERPWENVTAFISTMQRDAVSRGVRLATGTNVINGGTNASGLPGTIGGKWVMTASEVRSYGLVLAACPLVDLFIGWRYDANYASRVFNVAAYQAAEADVAAFCAGQVRG